jgi:hypothetical protein
VQSESIVIAFDRIDVYGCLSHGFYFPLFSVRSRHGCLTDSFDKTSWVYLVAHPRVLLAFGLLRSK